MGLKAEFCRLQEKSMYAIITGQSPIVSIMSTREGKSMLFMLPIYCVNEGTIIVIILLCLLQEDLKRQCRESYIEYI
jgi:superfamily II DNA helicase RecQ